MTTFSGFDHVQVCCPPGGEAAAREFYGDLLGLEEVAKRTPQSTPTGCWFAAGAGQGLHIGVLDPFVPATKAHPAFRVTDVPTLESIVARIEQAGFEVAWAEVPVAEARCKITDPFGNLIELLVGTTG